MSSESKHDDPPRSAACRPAWITCRYAISVIRAALEITRKGFL
jgi:hypothetical protein